MARVVPPWVVADAPAISFRLLQRDDFPLVGRWIAAPHVQRWWTEPSDAASVEARYGPSVDGGDPTRVFLIEVHGQPIGLIQRYRNRDTPEWDRAVGIAAAAGIDYLIGETDWIGRGVGAAAIRAFTATVWEAYPEVEVVTAAPQQANVASWRALERAGYARVWAGTLDSDDPSDGGPAFVYACTRVR